MAQVDVLIHTKLVDRDLRRATHDVQRHMHGLGHDAGRDFGVNLARGIQASQPKITRAFDDSTAATDRLIKAEQQLTKAYKSGDREQVIRATDRLTRVYRNQQTEVVRLAKAQRGLHGAIGDDRSMRSMVAILPNMTGGLTDAAGAAGDAAGTFGKLGATMGRLGPAAAVAAPAVAGVGLALTSLVGIAAQASGVLGLLPGLLATAGAGVAAFKLGMSGFSDVMGSLRDPEAFAESIRKLAPSAQQAAMAIRQMVPAFDDLKRATQDELFAGIGPQLNQFVNALLPSIRQLTTGVAAGLNQTMSAVMGQLQTPETMTALHSMIGNIVQAFQNLAPAAAPFTQAITQLASVGASFMPQLADAIAEGAQAFADFIDEAARSGDLQEFIQGGIDAMAELGPIVVDTARAFISLAPVGERVLPLIGDTMEIIADIMGPIGTMVAEFTPAFALWEMGVLQVRTAFDVVKNAANALIPTLNRINQVINLMLEPVRAAIDLANKVPGVNLSNIPEIVEIGPIGSHPGNKDSRNRRTDSPARPGSNTAGLPPFTSAPSSANSWWGGVELNVPKTWNQQEHHRNRLAEIQEAATGGAGGAQGPEVPYTGDPMELLQGFPVDASLYGAAGSVLDAQHRRAQAEAELNALLADNTATAEQIQAKRNELAKADREAYEAELRLNEAKQSAAESQRDSMHGLANDLQDIGAQFDSDFGISKGLGGVVEQVVKFVTALAMAPAMGPLSQIAGQYPNAGKGIVGMAAGTGAFGPQYLLTPQGMQGGQQYGGGYGGGNPNADQMIALAQHANGGQYSWGGTDLVNGLADCSGSISELVSVLTGRGTGKGRLFTTDSFPAYAAQNGWTQGYTPGGMNVGVRHGGPGGGHMASTINGVNFEAGGNAGGISYGGNAAGALDFPEIWSRPLGPMTPTAAPPLYGPANTSPALAPLPPPGSFPGGGSMLPGTGMPSGIGPMGGPPQGAPMQNGVGGAASAMPQYGARSPGEGGWQAQGGGFAGLGGLPMSAIQAGIGAAGAAGAPFGGQAGAAAAQMGMEMLNRTAGWGGQAAGIVANGLLETFGMNQSVLGDPSQSWFGRVFAGFAGARPSLPASAGQTEEPLSAQQQDPNKKQGEDQQQQQPGGPLVNIETLNNNKGDNEMEMANNLNYRINGAAQTSWTS